MPARLRRGSATLLWVVLLLLSAVGACTTGVDRDTAGQSPAPSAEPAPTPEPAPAPEPTPTPTPEPPEDPAPLTGLAAASAEVGERRALAVKIDNAVEARPSVGLAAADVVVTEPVEGGVTRFAAIYQSGLPPEVGPVRSAREVDADLLPAFGSLMAISGAAPEVVDLLAEAELTVFEEGRPVGAWRREPSRLAPHNLVVDTAALEALGGAVPPAEPLWDVADRLDGGQPLVEAILRYRPGHTVRWRWDGSAWLRAQDGEAQRDAAEAAGPPTARLTAANVVVVEVVTRRGERVDGAGNPTVEVDVVGQGPLVLLRDGVAHEGRWRRDDGSAPWRFEDAAGSPMPLQRGVTWIELLPADGALELGSGEVPPGSRAVVSS